MDDRARAALQDLARAAVLPAIDQLHGEVERLRWQVAVLERAAGLATTRLAPAQRQEQVAALRERGLSTSLIARSLAVGRDTVMKDLRVLQLPPPTATVGSDGVTRRYHSHAVNGSQPAG